MPATRRTPALAAGVALALAVSLAGCGDDGDDDVASTSATESSTASSASQGAEPSGDGYPGVTVTGEVGESSTITVDGAEAPTELVAVDLVEGDGAEVPEGATISVHYLGVLLDGTEFDGSFGGAPVTFPLSGVIPGWTEGIPGMHEGGRRLLVIPPELAYGASGSGPIGPDEPLIFVVDVVEVVG